MPYLSVGDSLRRHQPTCHYRSRIAALLEDASASFSQWELKLYVCLLQDGLTVMVDAVSNYLLRDVEFLLAIRTFGISRSGPLVSGEKSGLTSSGLDEILGVGSLAKKKVMSHTGCIYRFCTRFLQNPSKAVRPSCVNGLL